MALVKIKPKNPTFSVSYRYVGNVKDVTSKYICTAEQYHFYGVAKVAWVCDKLS
jgi:hypothetical protein